MKKIGIITFHSATNYGALLQTYGLQKALITLGYDSEIINYYCYPLIKQYSPLDMNKVSIGELLKLIYNFFPKLIRNVKFNKFRKTFLVQSKLVNSETVSKLAYDKYISGSDQVFNYKITDFDKAYFLNFVNDRKKKYAYAASFGLAKIDDDKINDYQTLLKQFNRLSVREGKAAELVRGLIGTDAPVVLDPTLLLEKKYWLELCTKKVKIKKYILLYCFETTDSILSLSQKLAAKYDATILRIPISNRPIKGTKKLCFVGPQVFLSLFKNAEAIVTNSFHGSAFSIIFEKEFYVELRANGDGINSRFETLLAMTGLVNRIIGKDISIVNDNKIDYIEVNKKLEIEREKSIKYLKEIIEE